MKQQTKKGTLKWKNGMDSEVVFCERPKPNLIKRFFIWLGVTKDKRRDGLSVTIFEMDEAGLMADTSIKDKWDVRKRYIAGCDPYEKKRK